MKQTTLGILGLGSRSTTFYIKELNYLYNQKKGGYSTCPFVLFNTDFDTINPLLPYKSKELDAALQSYFDVIQPWNFSHLLLPNITLHESIDQIKIDKICLHPVHLTIAQVKKNNWDKVVLFGSLYSMNSDYITALFKENNIEILIPQKKDQFTLDQMRHQIYNESETEETINTYHQLIDNYSQKYPVVLSCTELSVLKPTNNPKLIDMAQVQIEAAINLL